MLDRLTNYRGGSKTVNPKVPGAEGRNRFFARFEINGSLPLPSIPILMPTDRENAIAMATQ